MQSVLVRVCVMDKININRPKISYEKKGYSKKKYLLFSFLVINSLSLLSYSYPSIDSQLTWGLD